MSASEPISIIKKVRAEARTKARRQARTEVIRMSHYPVKISQQPDGTYTWTCPIEAEYYRNSMRPGLYACIGIAVFLLIFGGVMSYSDRDLKSFLIVAGCAGVFLLITFAVFGLAFSAKDPQESYEMREECVKSGYGKSSVWFEFRKVKTIVLGKNI